MQMKLQSCTREKTCRQVSNLEKIDGLCEELEVVVVCAVLGEQDQVAEGHFGWRDQGWVTFYMLDTLEGPRDTGGLDPPSPRIMELGERIHTLQVSTVLTFPAASGRSAIISPDFEAASKLEMNNAAKLDSNGTQSIY
ncbi:hypothetical protein B0H17DRAFT_1186429 [Mycena rosella]|uniref:Uncharacterized protein n=1 Tax=Mycena rosella TaxID=1033263 RepID=A0AAD7G3Z2_MYCRO|nr:hypothetical protein B0H17DRAFT_1186429 [Mycena rosella]